MCALCEWRIIKTKMFGYETSFPPKKEKEKEDKSKRKFKGTKKTTKLPQRRKTKREREIMKIQTCLHVKWKRKQRFFCFVFITG